MLEDNTVRDGRTPYHDPRQVGFESQYYGSTVCLFVRFRSFFIRFSNHSLNETKLAKIFTAQSKLREEKVGKKITLIIRNREGYRIRFV